MRKFANILSVVILGFGIISCTGGNSANGGLFGSTNPLGPKPLSSAPGVYIGNITPIPTNSGLSSTSVVVDNNLATEVFLVSSNITQDGQTKPINPNVVNLSLCQKIAASSSCNIGITPPSTVGNFVLNLTFTDGKKNYQTSQIITYTNLIPATNGFIYATLNNNIYKPINQRTTITVPFILDQDYISVTASTNNPAFMVNGVSCPANSFTKGSLCTVFVQIGNIGSLDMVVASLTINGTFASTKKVKKSGSNLINIPIVVTQNVAANLLTSAINPVISPSNGSSPVNISLLNSGSESITSIQISSSSTAPGGPVLIESNLCATLAINGACTFNINQRSTLSGTALVLINYTSASGKAAVLTFNASYLNMGTPSLALTSGVVNLNNTLINTTQLLPLTIQNNGSVNFTNINFTPSSSLGSPFLSYDTGASSCKTDGTQSLAQGSSCTLIIKYAPTTVESLGTLRVIAQATYIDNGNPVTYTNGYSTTFSAVSSPALLYLVPNIASYSIRADNVESVIQQFTLINVGSTQAIAIGAPTSESAPTGFSVTGNTCSDTLNSNESCLITTKYGPTTVVANNAQSKLNVQYNPNAPGMPIQTTSFAYLNFNSSTAALIVVESIVVTNATPVGIGAWSFVNSPTNKILIATTYKNNGTSAATNFNVGLNNIPIGYSKDASTTCATGTSVQTLAVNGSCIAAIYAIDPSSIYNPYGTNGAINVNIPGFSYFDTGTGNNLVPFPTYNFGSGAVNQIGVTSTAFANVNESNPSPVNRNVAFNLTFTATAFAGGITEVIASVPGLSNSSESGVYIVGNTSCNINTPTGNCIITLNTSLAAPVGTYRYQYLIRPSTESAGMIGYFTFTLQ